MSGTRRIFTPRTALHRSLVLGTIGASVAALAFALATNASANLSGSTFEGNDGNLAVTTPGNTDWANVAGLHTGTDTPSGSTDNAFGGGTKEDGAGVNVVDGSIPPNKNDLTRFYEASEQAASGSIYLYLGWERLVNIGNANLDFEINQNKTAGFTANSTGAVTLNRTAGDALVTYDFGGSGTPTIGLLRWLTSASVPAVPGFATNSCFSASGFPCWGDRVNLTASGFAEAAVNTAPVPESVAGGTIGTGLFGEAAINLTAAGVFQSGVCSAFGTTFVKSRSSSSFTAEMKDFIAPVDVNISNCGSITIHKVTQNGDSSFGYTTTGSLTPSTFSLSNGGQRAYTNVASGSYSVTENLSTTQVGAGWTLADLSCTKTGATTSFTVSGATVSITEGFGGIVDCTYTNHINLSPTIATTLSATTVNIGDAVHDSSALTGATANAGGTVTYHAYAGANTCSGTDLLNSQKTVSGGVVPDSDPITFNAAGSYSFQAVYSGDGNNNGATSVCSTEQLLVKTNPSIGTTLSATSVDVGSTVHDSATLSGATTDAGGTVTYTVYTNSACTAGARSAGTVTVTAGSVPDSNALAFNTAGTFYWQAVYSGDTKNNSATSTCTDETLTVNPKHPTASTAQDLLPNDSFTLSGGFNPTGTIDFYLYAPGDTTCSGTAVLHQQVTVNGNGTYSTTNTTIHATTEGTYRWASTYSGDGNNAHADSTCGTEHFTLTNS